MTVENEYRNKNLEETGDNFELSINFWKVGWHDSKTCELWSTSLHVSGMSPLITAVG